MHRPCTCGAAQAAYRLVGCSPLAAPPSPSSLPSPPGEATPPTPYGLSDVIATGADAGGVREAWGKTAGLDCWTRGARWVLNVSVCAYVCLCVIVIERVCACVIVCDVVRDCVWLCRQADVITAADSSYCEGAIVKA